MFIQKLTITGLRAISQASFDFQPGMNLLVGVNGVGKTTVLEALRVCLLNILPEVTVTRSVKQSFSADDITIGHPSMQVDCDFDFEGVTFNLLIHKNREGFVAKKTGDPRNQVIETADIEQITPVLNELFPNAKQSKTQPLGICFSTRRSLFKDQKLSGSLTAGGQAAAFAESLLENREINIRQITQWYNVQEELAAERPIAAKHAEVLREAVTAFMPGFSNLRLVETDDGKNLTVDKNRVPFNISQLSDGERGVLGLVMDLARRLSQANPELENPVKDGKAVVLIDELDLHLHPKWQRSIVANLTATFPNCQFIATTHSPQIITSVEPEKVQLIKDNEVIWPDRTLGMDTNWILRHIMETDERPENAQKAIDAVAALIEDGEFEAARDSIAEFKGQKLDLPEWSVLEARMARLEIISEQE